MELQGRGNASTSGSTCGRRRGDPSSFTWNLHRSHMPEIDRDQAVCPREGRHRGLLCALDLTSSTSHPFSLPQRGTNASTQGNACSDHWIVTQEASLFMPYAPCFLTRLCLSSQRFEEPTDVHPLSWKTRVTIREAKGPSLGKIFVLLILGA